MLNKLKFAVEKFTALLTSQRTQTTAVGVVVLVGMIWKIAAAILGVEAGELPSEDELKLTIEQSFTVVATAMTSMIGVVVLIARLVEGMNERPPTLNSSDYENIRKNPPPFKL